MKPESPYKPDYLKKNSIDIETHLFFFDTARRYFFAASEAGKQTIIWKIWHPQEVEEIILLLNNGICSKEIADSLALLHDIGRFPEVVLMDELNSDDYNHGEAGYWMVKNSNLPWKDDSKFLEAILYHDKITFIDNNPLLNLIRDADRLTIILHLDRLLKNMKKDSNSGIISPDMWDTFLKGDLGKKNQIHSSIDKVLFAACWLFNFHFQQSTEFALENHLDDIILDCIEKIQGNKSSEYYVIQNQLRQWRENLSTEDKIIN